MKVFLPFLEQSVPDVYADRFFEKIAPLRFGSIADHRISTAHWHLHPQIWYTLRGSYYQVIDGKKVLQTPGSVTIVPPFHSHRIDSSESDLGNTEVYSIIFPSDSYDKNLLPFFPLSRSFTVFNDTVLPVSTQLHGEEKEQADDLFRSIVSTIAPDNQEFRFSKIFSILNSFFETCAKQTDNKKIEKATVTSSYEHSKRIHDSVQFSLKNFHQPISIEDARKVAIMSRRSFTENFKSVTGRTYTEFVTNLRTRQAISHLRATDMTVGQIAAACGYANSGHLISVCTKYCGMTPLQVREKYQQWAEQTADFNISHSLRMMQLNKWNGSETYFTQSPCFTRSLGECIPAITN